MFLKLANELASDATPMIDIVAGQGVEDMAGNFTGGNEPLATVNNKEVQTFDAKDGIAPVLSVSFSGGSGKGTGDEGPDKLTKDRIVVHVTADEEAGRRRAVLRDVQRP